MNWISPTNNLEMSSFIDRVTADQKKGMSEDNKANKTSLRAHSEKIKDKRQERIDNLQEQIKGASSGGCLKFMKSVFKVFDLLLKPLSVISGGMIKLELSKITKAIERNKELGIKIDGTQIQQGLQGLKKLLEQDMQKMQVQDNTVNKQNERILQIIDEIHNSFNATNNT